MNVLFAPRSIAIVGASSDPARIGGRPVDYLKRFGYAGRILPVNPGHERIQELPAFKSLSAIGEAVDLAIVAVPAARVLDTLAEARSTGVKGVVLFSSGFAEIGEAGQRAQAELTRIAKQSGMRIVGPNCLGLMSAVSRVYATFTPLLKTGVARRGVIGLASQSGAFGAYAYGLARERGLGLSHWITTGNEADVELSDSIRFFAADADTRVILAYCEGVRDGPKFIAALEAARAAGKPVVITKVGRSAAGAAAAASHTASLAGEDAVYDAVFEQYGAIRARSVDEMFDLGYGFSVGQIPRGRRLAIVTVSGGVGVLMADDAMDCGVELPQTRPEAQKKILDRVNFAAPRNPVDVTGQVTNDHGILDHSIDALLERDDYDALALFFSVSTLAPEVGPLNIATARRLRERYPGVLALVVSALLDGQRQALEQAGCLCFADPSRAVRTFASMARFRPGARGAQGAAAARIAVRAGAYTEPEALSLLAEHGIAAVPHRVARSEAEAASAAQAIGFPVAMKIVSPGILHKTDAGGVRLRVGSTAEAQRAFADIVAACRRHSPSARIDGVLIAPMVAGGVECVLGVKRDAVFGPVVMFGLGGIHVEVLRDVSFRRAPFDEIEARAMVDAIRGRALLAGVRGQPPADVGALVGALAALSRFALAAGDSLDSLDINPFVVLPSGQGAMALDALIIGAKT